MARYKEAGRLPGSDRYSYISELAAADLQMRLQRPNEARQHYQRVADAVPHSEEGKLARRALAKLAAHQLPNGMLILSSNFTDRLYFLYLFLVSAGLLLRPGRVSSWSSWLFVNFLCLVALGLLVRNRQRSPAWEFLHNWYPLVMFVVCFEEVSHLSFLLRDAWQDHYLLRLEAWLFPVPPTVWLGRLGSPAVTELMELGYFSYFVLFMIVGGVLYGRREKRAFRQVMDTTVLSYLICYAVFILFPTEGPAYTLAAQHSFPLPGAGPFHWTVMLIQQNAGVHGNAFPSAHVAGAVVALIFAWRHAPKLGLSLTPLVILLCLGAVYDCYHYLSDVVAGVVVGAVPAEWVMAGADWRREPCD